VEHQVAPVPQNQTGSTLGSRKRERRVEGEGGGEKRERRRKGRGKREWRREGRRRERRGKREWRPHTEVCVLQAN